MGLSRSRVTPKTEIGMCCFSAKHAVVLRRKSKDWLARNQDNVQIIANISTKCVAIFSVMFDIAISHNHRIGKFLHVSSDLLALYAITGHCVLCQL